MSGTSMSAPQVSAGLAIVQTIIKDLSALETEKKIKDFASFANNRLIISVFYF